MRRKKLIFSLICILTLFFIFSFFFVEKNHSHECHTLDCEICEQVLIYEKKLGELKLHSTCISSFKTLSLIFNSIEDIDANSVFNNKTLITLKTELLT